MICVQNELRKYEKEWNSQMEHTTKICKEYSDIKSQREKCQKLIETEIKKCNELIEKENKLFHSKYSIELISNQINEKKKNYKSLFDESVALITQYNTFIATNQSNVNSAQERRKNKWTEFEKHWREKDHWKVNDVIAWFKYKQMRKV